MFVKTKEKNRFGSKLGMNNILFNFDHNGVAEIDDSHLETVKTMTKHPFKLTILKDYDPKEEERKIAEKKLKALKKDDLISIAGSHGIDTVKMDGDKEKELTVEELREKILEKLV